MKKLPLIAAMIVALAVCDDVLSASTPTPKIWLSMGGISAPEAHASWDTLFYRPDATWPEFMNHVQAVGILTQALVKIPDADLGKVVARLKKARRARHRDAGAGLYVPGVDAPTHCGEGVEGYFAPAETAALAAKLERAGGALAYIAMDEPLWFGHYYHEKNACHSSIDKIS